MLGLVVLCPQAHDLTKALREVKSSKDIEMAEIELKIIGLFEKEWCLKIWRNAKVNARNVE